MDYLIIMLRTLFISFVIFFMIRKKAVHDLFLFDFVLLIMVAQLAVSMILDRNRPIMETALPIGLLLFIQFLFSRSTQKEKTLGTQQSEKNPLFIKREANDEFQESLPVPLIIDGRIQEEQLQKINQTSLWIRQQMRMLGYRDIKKISYCALKGQHTFFVDVKEEKW